MSAKQESKHVSLRIRVQAYDAKVLDLSVEQILEALEQNKAKVKGPVPLPTVRKKYTVNRSPFVYEDSRDQLEVRVHRRMLEIANPSAKLIEYLGSLDVPSNVSIGMKVSQ